MVLQLLRYLSEATLHDFAANKIFLGITAAVVIISILRRSKILPVMYFGLIALGMVISRTIPLEGPATINFSIFLFGTGVLVVVAVAIYFLLIKSD